MTNESPFDKSTPKEQDTLSSTDYVRAVVNILEDIGDEKARLETTQKAVLNILEDLEDEKRSAQEANRMKSEFLANMSHELRTPLNSIIGFSEIMSDGKVGPIAENHKEYLGDILTSARHLLQLINDVLDLAKVEAGKLEFDAMSINISKLIHGIRDTLRSIAASRNIHVDVQIDDDLEEVISDPARLKQVLYNYLSNALKFTTEGGHVLIRAEHYGDDFFKISVQDTGEGIAREHLSRLFIEFEQLDASIAKRHQGTGLGLALTKRIVEAQRGQVGVESRVGEGSTFFAILPTHLHPEHLDNTVLPRNVSKPDKRLPNVLVVENDPSERSELIQLLENSGYEPQGVALGEEAIEYASLQAWDAITFDLNLPDINSSKVIAKIRSTALNSRTPVIIVTALPDDRIVSLSVQEVLIKPFDASTLTDAIKRTVLSGAPLQKIMVIDNQLSDLNRFDNDLQAAGYQSLCYSNTEQALGDIEPAQPDLIILNLLTLEVQHDTLLRDIKRLSYIKHIPLIILTKLEFTELSRLSLLSNSINDPNKSEWHRRLMDELSQHVDIHKRPSFPESRKNNLKT